MTKAKSCLYKECWYNDNVRNRCTAPEITLDFTGSCEKLMHCDEYICNKCEKFDICEKDKKQDYLKKNKLK